GDYIWATQAGGSSWDMGHGITSLSDGSAIVTGFFAGSADFGDITLTATAGGDHDIFIAKLNPDGEFVWATQAGGVSGFAGDIGHGITSLSDGSAIVTGEFKGTAAFGGITLTAAGSWEADVFIAKLNPDGSWASAEVVDSVNDEEGDVLVGRGGTSSYELFTDVGTITLTDKKGKSVSAQTSDSWDAIKAVKTDSGFQVLLAGAAGKEEGKYKVWTVNSEGKVTKQTPWKKGKSMMKLGYEEIFNEDLDGDSIIGNPPIDSDSNGLADGTSSYELFTDVGTITLTDKNGESVSDQTSDSWDAIKAVKTDSGFQVLLAGAAGKEEGKYKVWTVNPEGMIAQETPWKDGKRMIKQGYEEIFKEELSGDGIIGSDKQPPKATKAFTENNQIMIMFDEIINGGKLSKKRFSVSIDGNNAKVKSAVIDEEDSMVILDLKAKTGIDEDSKVLISYNDPQKDQRTNVVQDPFGNDLESFTGFTAEVF
ncbi:MAG: SwmB domain-containing protein, partial [Prochlorococcus sp.]